MAMGKIYCEVIGDEVKGCLYLKGKTVEKNPTCLKCSYFKELKNRNIDPDKIRKDGCYWVYERGFTRLPPQGDIDINSLTIQAFFARSQIPFDEVVRMEMPEELFIKTKNPIYGFQAFMVAIGRGFYPSLSILLWLSEAFKKYVDSNGAPGSLEKLLGITGKQKQGNAFEQIRRIDRNIGLMMAIFRLTRKGVKPKEAAQRVAKSRKLNTEGLDWKTIQNMYSQQNNFKNWI
jgi:hypothetical protein